MPGWYGFVTAGQADHWLAVRQACEAVGFSASEARLIHHYSNAIYVLPAENVVARVTYGGDAADRVRRSQAITRWLTQDRRFPATRPFDGTNPVIVNSAVVSFWAYYPQPDGVSAFTSGDLAALLRLLHEAGTPPVSLPSWVPLTSLHATVEDPVLSAALTDEERDWILTRITDMRETIAGLDWPLGTGLIHGDAWAGNLLACPGAPPARAVVRPGVFGGRYVCELFVSLPDSNAL